jgi:hypothetical protein
MSKDLWDAAGYDSYDYSILLFLTLLSGRVQVDKLLLEGVPVFSNYVTPESTVGSSKSCFFLVSRKANEGKKHLVLFIDGALVCDCKLFHQFGFWCKHAFSVFDYGGIDFNVSLAVDESYSFTSKKEFESICRRTTEFLHITKNWDWGNKNANHAVVNNSGTVVMSTQLNDRVNTEKSETASQARRAAALKVVTDANGNAELGKMFDEFYEAFCKRKAELARSHKINETNSTGLLNPLPNNRKVMQLAENNSYTVSSSFLDLSSISIFAFLTPLSDPLFFTKFCFLCQRQTKFLTFSPNSSLTAFRKARSSSEKTRSGFTSHMKGYTFFSNCNIT